MSELPAHLRRGIDRAAGQVDRGALRRAVERLQLAYVVEQPTRDVIVRDDMTALAYAAYRLPATFAAARHVLAQVPPELHPVTLLDLGGGSGAAAWAAAAAFGPDLAVTVVDQSRPALALGERLQEGSSNEFRWWAADVDDDLPDADMVMLGYVISELSATRTAALMDRARAAAGSTVAVLEPGTPAGFERILAVRQGMLDAGWSLVAPCPHEEACPWAGEGRDWCHASTRVQRMPLQQQLKGGTLGHEDEKVAYVVASRTPVATPMARVLRHPRKPKGMVEFPVCHRDGEVHDVTVTKRHGDAYRAARKVAWGDAWDPEADR